MSQEAPREGSLRGRAWKRFVCGSDDALKSDLYIPALGLAVRYDRCCAYFSSSVLAAAARGFGGLIQRLKDLGANAPRPAVRLVVNEELSEEDVLAMTETGSTEVLEEQLRRRFKTPTDALERDRLAMLAWLMKERLLDIRVGVMRRGNGIVHSKFGIITDPAGDSLVFAGSSNESAQALQANYEHVDVRPGWVDREALDHFSQEFESLWNNSHTDVATCSLPEALRLKLIKFAPKEMPTAEPGAALDRLRAAMVWRFIIESQYLPNGARTCDATSLVEPWPHQRRVVEETSAAWPAGRLLCEEVGMGKTIEAILILRRLMAGRGVGRALILLPAGLLKQWQAELREKGGILAPRLQGLTLIWPDDREERVDNLAQALDRDLLLMSRETARGENNLPHLLAARPWDLVILDESHAARRKKQEEGEYNSGTLLLNLLRHLQLKRQVRGFLLLSATPMQTHPWEPWDLLAVLGEGGPWLAEFSAVRNYYQAMAEARVGRVQRPVARRAASVIASDEGALRLWDGQSEKDIVDRMLFAKYSEREGLSRKLKSGSPLVRRMHRNTRETLRKYFMEGFLTKAPPRRVVQDIVFDFVDDAEGAVYERISHYIEERFKQLEKEKGGKGFVMTVYRRRAASSPIALRESLNRRRDGLLRVETKLAYGASLETTDVPEDLDPDDLPEEIEGGVSSAYPADARAAQRERIEVEDLLERIKGLHGKDTKRDRFFEELRRHEGEGRKVLVFTEYVDTLNYLRENLVDLYGSALGCYSGDGGRLYDGQKWNPVTKDEVTKSLREGRLQVLLCTDAASEGLNLQAASAVINYDLPWSPSKVEQRIGRVDRIGQENEVVVVSNLLLNGSIDEQVYSALRRRCHLFEHFVGAMQPVLSLARRMLIGHQDLDISGLEAAAKAVEQDILLQESYVESDAAPPDKEAAAVDLDRIVEELRRFPTPGILRVEIDEVSKSAKIQPKGRESRTLSWKRETLEAHKSVSPLNPLSEDLKQLADVLSRPGDRLPLVFGAHQRGAFRSTVALWVDPGQPIPIRTLAELKTRLERWTGAFPDPKDILAAERRAQDLARQAVEKAELAATASEDAGLGLQRAAAQIRLIRELGRFLVSWGAQCAPGDLNQVLHDLMEREFETASRVRTVFERLGGAYPQWPESLVADLRDFSAGIGEAQRKGRRIGRELDAALQDPRWQVPALAAKAQ